ncbi:xanthine dehydrogenase family protein subunit M [Nonomuraea sp. K274]|uniref:Xanthine dehydrogenase family protein subunit M n=1 Tax=Nonomuraea cypriaca TaxID=1187855 RepID=A0A931ADW9_9ACTN|nr:xanthine dehydrogenase family protein subunit M [Nonomuraea cypriaca]MBF8189825.1 xanthine dehydrogenase family protein subunit M [Nonomuraea cypriaca]
MKPAPFDYIAPASVPEAVGVLAERGADSRVLAGGQSLLIELRYRTARPALVVDVNRIPGLSEITVEDGSVHVGALVRHAQLEHARFDDPLAGLFREVAPYVAHPPVRARGTFAGSLAWAHPASEWCALAMALDAGIELEGPSGTRTVSADSWFRGPFATACLPEELVTGVRLPRPPAGATAAFAELRRTHGSFALAAAMVVLRLAGGRVDWVRIGLANAADVPLRAMEAERLMTGERPERELLAQAAARAAAESDPADEPHAPAAYRRHAIGALVRRCLTQAVERAETP